MAIRMNWWTRISPTKVYEPRMHKALPKRLNWEQIEKKPRQEGRNVVKGPSKRVIVVKSPDPKIFEQAIFIVKEDYKGRDGAKAGDVLREAQQVADDYVRDAVAAQGNFLRRLPHWVFAAVGAGGAAVLWFLLELFGI